MKKRVGAILIIVCLLISVMKINAQGFSVTKTDAVLYTAQNAGIYAVTDANTAPIVTLQGNLPIKVTGVTSNGWYEIDYNGIYYMQANGLKSPTIVDGVVFTYSDAEIQKLTLGTFAFYTEKELKKINKTMVMDMNDNAYLRYIDSYIMGKSDIDNCIIKESGLKLCEYVSGKIAANSSYSAKTNKEILIDYRIDFLAKSIEGPHRTAKSISQALIKMIRYDKESCTMTFKNASILDSEEKMKSIMDENIELLKKEQGVIFEYTMEYKEDSWNIHVIKK